MHRLLPSCRAGSLLRAGLGAALVAVGLSVVPLPTVTSVADYRVDREPLRFEPMAAVQEAPSTDGEVISRVAEVEPFVTIGVALPEVPMSPVSVRWRDDAGWSDWHELEVEVDKGPDRSSDEATKAADHRTGVVTEPLWIGKADAYQVRLPRDAADGTSDTTTSTTTSAPIDGPGPEVVVVRPDGQRLEVESDSVPAGAQSVGQPAIRTRGEWGARAPSNSVGTASSLKLAVVHHSATGNDYSPADVPGIIRSIQAFHIDGNGWSDIGYNFIVDKFGGMWEGRDGSLLRNSIGAHAEGFNTGSVGVMALGNYTAGAPGAAQVTNIADVIAWKFANAGIDPNTRVDFTSGGSSTIPAGQVVNLPRVVGHRDVGSTDCPGSNLYAQLSSRIRPILPALVAGKASPVGIIDVAAAGPRSIVLSGWAFDPLETDPIEIHVYVDGVGRNLGPTPIERPDLAAAYPGVGTRHGFSTTIGDLAPGSHSVCVFGINTGPGSNSLLFCRDITVPTGDPVGFLEQVAAGPDGTIGVGGWAFDPDQMAPADIHVYVDGRGFNTGAAALYRPDIAAAYPGFGGNRGFGWVGSGFAPGRHEVCVFAANVGAGGNNLLGCRTVTTPGGAPTGIVDAVVTGPDGTLGVFGWTIDPDTAASTDVHVYLDGRGANIGRASSDRSDIAGLFPGYGARHGFSWTAAGLAPGAHSLCVFAIDTGGGTNSLLYCGKVNVPGGSPFGAIDNISAGGSRINVAGWVIDPDTVGAVEAHVYVDSTGYNTGPAGQPRPDVAAVVAGYGPFHGLSWTSPVLAPGQHSVCVFGVNRGVGSNTLLNCRTVTV